MYLLLASVFCVVAVAQGQTGSRSLQYEYFDDYLMTVAAPKQHNEVLKDPIEDEISPASEASPTEDTPSETSGGMTYVEILGYFRDVPREHWSCCMLGMLAGNKGFHCNAAFYAARVATRNTNRSHNRNLPFHGRHRIPNWGREIMHTFSRCVVNHSEEFHKCCYAATVERRELVRWQQYREIMSGSFPLDDASDDS